MLPADNGLHRLFEPRSVALVGITVSEPQHWTRTFLDALLASGFERPIYLVNPKGGEIKDLKVYPSLTDVPAPVDYVIGTVPARVAPSLLRQCATKGVRCVHFCTAGFSETGEKQGSDLEAELLQAIRETGVRVLGPNCMGIYCPKSRMSFDADFPQEIGPVSFLSQSGGNVNNLVRQVKWRGVRFSKAVSYGNACDLDESDFLQYFATDPDTRIISMYIEGVKDGGRFLKAVESVPREKPMILLKGGVTQGGSRAAAGHTGALAGSRATWDSLCRQMGIITVRSLDEMADVLVTFQFMRPFTGRNVGLIGIGGGSSVLIADAFEAQGFSVPSLPEDIRGAIRGFTPAAGNILRNPIDYGQGIGGPEDLIRTVRLVAGWDRIHLVVGFLRLGVSPPSQTRPLLQMTEGFIEASRLISKPMAIVTEFIVSPRIKEEVFPVVERCVEARLPVYYSFRAAAKAIGRCMDWGPRETP